MKETAEHPNSGDDLHQTVALALDRWRAQGRPLVGAFIQGSSARRGAVAPGSDVDLCIVVPTPPDPAWFEECLIGSHVVEIMPLDAATCTDPDLILASPALPFTLCEGIIVDDPHGAWRTLRARLAPHLCATSYRRARASSCYEQIGAADRRVSAALAGEDLAGARYEVTIGLWHTLGLAGAIACRCPTNRRGFVYLWEDANRWGCHDLIVHAQRALGCVGLTEQDVRSLAEVAGAIKERHRRGILAMAEQGEVEQAAWPLLQAAIWRSSGDTHRPEAQARILSALGYDSLTALRQRQDGARQLVANLWRIAQTLVDNPSPADDIS